MASIEDLRQWIGKDVVEAGGDKVGRLADVYFDVESDQPLFLVVDLGRRHPSVLVPAWNASTTPDHVAVPYDDEALDGAPEIDPAVGLSVQDEQSLFSYYRVEYTPSGTGSRRRLMRR